MQAPEFQGGDAAEPGSYLLLLEIAEPLTVDGLYSNLEEI